MTDSNMRPVVVLASASPARRMLLQSAGIEFTVQPSAVDEDALIADLNSSNAGANVSDVVALLAAAKCAAVAASFNSSQAALIIGCDSMLDVDGIALGKPGTADAAVARWQQMRGRSGILRTGHHVALVHPGAAQPTYTSEVVSTVVHFADISDDEIAAYVATGEPLHVAGAFTLDSLGAAFIRGVEGDHANVVGLSIAALRRLVADLGVRWTDLWAPTA